MATYNNTTSSASALLTNVLQEAIFTASERSIAGDLFQVFDMTGTAGLTAQIPVYPEITADDLTRAATNTTTTATDSIDSSITASFGEGNGFIPMPSSIVSVVNIFPFDDNATNNMFDIRYQLRLNDLYDFSSTSIIHYQMTMQHLDFLSHILVGEKPLRFNQHQNRLYIDMDWSNDISAGEFLIIECYRKIDPASYSDIFDDIHLKRYATALIKRQWGANLSKFNGVAMLGGVTMNGETIYSQAQEEIEKLEELISITNSPPMMFGMG